MFFTIITYFIIVICALLQETIHSQCFIISTENGKIEGRTAYTIGKNKSYYVFQGIPYAKPPVGNLRFKEPQPIGNWDVVKPTLIDPPPCLQLNGFQIIGQEDCLYLNVYTTQLSSNTSLLPVMVWIHGGGFESGSSNYDENGPDYFLDEDVAFVSLNYRLGIFGFLSLGDLVVPGNNGLKDQNLAMHWIKKNIQNFGGDPNQITLFGHSAGSASASYHLESPLSTGLFNRIILQSGTSYCLWSLSRIAPEIARDVAVILSIDTSSSESILAGLKEVNVNYLLQAAETAKIAKYLEFNPRNGLIYAPVIEPMHAGAFLSERSYQLIKSNNYNNVTVMMGYTSLEASTSVTSVFRIFLTIFDSNPSYLVPIDMNIENSVIKDAIGREIKFEYFGLIPIAFSNYAILKFISDDQFVRPIQELAKMLAKNNPIYLYKFRYVGDLGGAFSRTTPGVAHGEELGYLFRRNIRANDTDSVTRSRMVTLWTNFAKYGNPTPELNILLQNQTWLPIDSNSTDVNYFDIDYNLKSSINPDEKSNNFWSRLYYKYGVPPYDTY